MRHHAGQRRAAAHGRGCGHRLFECRSRQLTGELDAREAAAYLSGLLIASDVHGGLDLASADATTESGTADAIVLIGAPALTRLYAEALAAQGRTASAIDGDAAALAGLAAVHLGISRNELVHAQ
jgi:2-dehydro-3-deoxygalactonokinase